MDSTNSASYWVAGIIVVLAIILGAWLIASNNNSVGIPNTGAQTTDTMNTGNTGNAGTAAGY